MTIYWSTFVKFWQIKRNRNTVWFRDSRRIPNFKFWLRLPDDKCLPWITLAVLAMQAPWLYLSLWFSQWFSIVFFIFLFIFIFLFCMLINMSLPWLCELGPRQSHFFRSGLGLKYYHHHHHAISINHKCFCHFLSAKFS